ncbi:MAG: error-prone DNA polymerase [Phycisphaerales bacterium]
MPVSAPPANASPRRHRFVDLEVTSNFTFLTGASHPHELVERAAALGAEAIAITDRASLAGIVRAHQAAKRCGIGLVVGARLGLHLGAGDLDPHGASECRSSDGRSGDESGRERNAEAAPDAGVGESLAGEAFADEDMPRLDADPRLHPHRPSPPDFVEVLVHVDSRDGYARLCRLITLGRRRAGKGRSRLHVHDLLEHGEGFWITLVPPRLVDQAFIEVAEGLARRDRADDPHLSIAIRRIGDPGEELRSRQLAMLASHLGVPLVAANDVHWHDLARRPLQDVLTSIRLRRPLDRAGLDLLGGGDRALQSDASMRARFGALAAEIGGGLEPIVESAVDRAGAIAERCLAFSLDELRYEYPREIVPAGRTPEAHLRTLVEEGARERYPPSTHPQGVPDRVRQRLEHELGLIAELDYARYFLTVHDLVRFARQRGILCQGRGAAANSVVCFCLGVTAVDPDRIETLFERFISKERNEPPDIDIDFEHRRREEVIQYLYRRYGRDRAALAAEVVCYRGRSAVREVGKALGFAPETLDRLAGGIDWWTQGAGEPDRVRELGFDPEAPAVRRLMALAGDLVGFPRHLSQHVGGFVITEGPLCESVPIENAAMADRTVIEWDKDDLDAMGMLKVDILALGMLSAIRRAIDLVNGADTRGEADAAPPARLEYHTVPSEDPAVYDMLCRGDSVGVFQVESRAQMNMLPRLRPRCFYDLVIEVAIVRPGPIQGDMVHPYLRRRRGEEPIEFPDDAVRRVLERTLGVPLFQEQAMALAIVAAGFTPGEADQLRRALAAWKRPGNAIDEFRRRLVEGMASRGYSTAFAEQVFERIRGFSGYGFPESHAASFALLVYVSAWLKCRHPAAFTAALLDSQPMGFYAPAQLVRDAREHGVRVRRLDVARSGWQCRLERDRAEIDPVLPEPFVSGESESRRVASSEARRTSGEHGWRSESGSRDATAGSRGAAALRLDEPAIRLGLELVRGLSQEEGEAIADAVATHGPPPTIEALWSQSGVSASAMRRLAQAEAFASLGLDRSQSLWQVRALPKRRLELFDGERGEASESARRPPSSAPLPATPRLRRLALDYGATGLSLRDHPIACLRPLLEARGVLANAALADEAMTEDGERVVVAGLVLCRQRPSTAKGTVFITLEDETGIANLVIRPKAWERGRRAGRHATVLSAEGKLQRREGTIAVIVTRLEDLTGTLASLDESGEADTSLAGRAREFR